MGVGIQRQAGRRTALDLPHALRALFALTCGLNVHSASSFDAFSAWICCLLAMSAAIRSTACCDTCDGSFCNACHDGT